jgi:type I restriction system adenine methylase HsdM
MYNVKQIRNEFKKNGVFYTPQDLALLIKKYACDEEPEEVYDPTCGDGSLLSVFGDGVKKYGQEINGEQLDVARSRLKNFDGVIGDTLKTPAFSGKKFKCIVANPPFSISWNPPEIGDLFTDKRFEGVPVIPPKSKADYAFILHILNYLSEDGTAAVLSFPGVLYRGNAEGEIRQWLVEHNFIDKVIRVPGKTFVDTPIETAIIVFKKNRKERNILFGDLSNDRTESVTFDKVKDNGFILCVNNFIIEKQERITHDPETLQTDARNQMMNKLKRDLEMDKIVCELEGYDFNSYIDELQTVLDSYR